MGGLMEFRTHLDLTKLHGMGKRQDNHLFYQFDNIIFKYKNAYEFFRITVILFYSLHV